MKPILLIHFSIKSVISEFAFLSKLDIIHSNLSAWLATYVPISRAFGVHISIYV